MGTAQAPSIAEIERMAEDWINVSEVFFSGPLKPAQRMTAKVALIEAIAIIFSSPAGLPQPLQRHPAPGGVGALRSAARRLLAS